MINITHAALHMRTQTFSCKDDCTLTKHTRRWTYSALWYFFIRNQTRLHNLSSAQMSPSLLKMVYYLCCISAVCAGPASQCNMIKKKSMKNAARTKSFLYLCNLSQLISHAWKNNFPFVRTRPGKSGESLLQAMREWLLYIVILSLIVIKLYNEKVRGIAY